MNLDLPIELIGNVASYIPIHDMIDENTSRERVNQLIKARAKEIDAFGGESEKILWTRVANGGNPSIIAKITILCNECISGILLYDPQTRKTVEWTLDTDIKPRDKLKLPKQGRYKWYSQGDKVRYDDEGYFTLNNEPVDEEAWNNFLLGEDEPEVEQLLKKGRQQFLEYDIIEHLTDERNEYYELLRIFRLLYNEGYGTYGGFKNFISGETTLHANRSENKMLLSRDRISNTYLSYVLTIDGTVTNFTSSPDKYSAILDDMRKIGLNVINTIIKLN